MILTYKNKIVPKILTFDPSDEANFISCLWFVITVWTQQRYETRCSVRAAEPTVLLTSLAACWDGITFCSITSLASPLPQFLLPPSPLHPLFDLAFHLISTETKLDFQNVISQLSYLLYACWYDTYLKVTNVLITFYWVLYQSVIYP